MRKRRRRKEVVADVDADAVEGIDMRGKQGREGATKEAQVNRRGTELRSLLDRVGMSSASSDSASSTIERGTGEGASVAGEEEDMRALFHEMKEEDEVLQSERRECPVPKPRGKIGELLGFGRDDARRDVEDGR